MVNSVAKHEATLIVTNVNVQWELFCHHTTEIPIENWNDKFCWS